MAKDQKSTEGKPDLGFGTGMAFGALLMMAGGLSVDAVWNGKSHNEVMLAHESSELKKQYKRAICNQHLAENKERLKVVFENISNTPGAEFPYSEDAIKLNGTTIKCSYDETALRFLNL